MNRSSSLPAVLAAALALAGCGRDAAPEPPAGAPPASDAAAQAGPPPPSPADAALLAGYHWQLVEARDAQGQPLAALAGATERPLRLDFADGRLGVGNLCNRMGGGYALEGDRLRVQPLVSTQMACADERLMALEREAGRRLQGEFALALEPGDPPRLALTDAAGDVLRFEGTPTAETRYGGPGDTVFLEVAAQTAPCTHPEQGPRQCLQVREVAYDANGVRTGEAGPFASLYEGIEGYAHEPGVRNVLRVKRFRRDPVPADASDTVYVLDMVVESETAN